MAPFNFRLQKVLDHRRMLVEQLRLDLAALERAHQQAAAALAELKRTEATALQEAQRRTARVLNLPAMIQATSHLDVLRERIGGQTALVQSIGLRVDAARAHLGTMAKGAKAFEKLREGQVIEHVRETRLQDQREAGEVAARQYRRLQGAR